MLFKTDQFCGDHVSSSKGEMHWFNRKNLPTLPVAPGFFDVLKAFV